MKRPGAVIGLVIIIGALGFGAFAFRGNLVNAVPYAQAKQAQDMTVQIMGAPVDGTMLYSTEDQSLHFQMRDTQGGVMPVVFKGPKPEDLDTAMKKATSINAIGSYNPSQSVFVAEKLLVKCPSKYQGTNGSSGERSYGGTS